MNRVILVGSPRANGRSAHLAEMLFEACIDECPEDEVYLLPVSELEIHGCVGCDACHAASKAQPVAEETDGDEPAEPAVRCPRFDDDMANVYDLLPEANELIVVSPVYFSGAPSYMKAMLDRLQPFFWTDARHGELRPATLHVIGEGHDPCGYDALVSEVQSATLVAGFRLERIVDWVGKISREGEIEAEAQEYALVADDADDADKVVDDEVEAAEGPIDVSPVAVGRDEPKAAQKPAGRSGGKRPKLSLSQSKPHKGSGSKKASGKASSSAGSGKNRSSAKPKGKGRG